MSSSIELAARLSAVVETQQQVLAAICDLEKVMAIIVDKTPAATSGSGAVIELLEGDELVYRAASGTAKPHIGLRLHRTRSLSGLAVAENSLIRCDDTETDPRVDGPACRAIGIRSMIIAPLLEGDTAVGALKTFSAFANAFGDLDAYALQLLAGMASGALLQARSIREHRASEERYRLLFERNIAGVFRSTMDGRILDCNEALVTSLGYASRDDLLSHPAWDLYHQRTDREQLIRMLETNQGLVNLRIPLKRKDGSSILGVINVSLIPAENDEKQLLGTVVEA